MLPGLTGTSLASALADPSLTWPAEELVSTTHTHPLATPTAALGALLAVQVTAVYVVLSHPQPDELLLAMALASFFPEKHGISAVVGGLLGARHGSTPMLERGAARLELAWSCDALGTDLAMTAMLTPLAKDPDGEPGPPLWGRDTAANGCDERRGGAPTRTRELPRRLRYVPTPTLTHP